MAQDAGKSIRLTLPLLWNLEKKLLRNHMFSLENKIAVITGAGSGIGKATALLFAQQRATVHLLDLNAGAVAGTATEIEALGGTAIPHSCNVTDQAEVRTTFENIGQVDILVNSAGVSHIGNLENTSEADFDRLYNVNIKGVYNCLYAAIPLMKKKRWRRCSQSRIHRK